MFRSKSVLVALAVAGLMMSGCGKGGHSDQSLTTDIQAKLYADAATKPANIHVAVKNGVVTLTGDVPSSDVELEAMRIANGATGVISVNDQLKINPAMASNEPPPPAGNTAPQPPPSSNVPTPQASQPPASAAAPPPPPSGADQNAPPAPAEPVHVTIPSGTQLSVRMIDAIDSAHNQTGQTFKASLNAPLELRGHVVIPRGANVTVLLADAKGAGRIKGNSELEVRATGIEYHGRTHPIDTTAYTEQGKARGKQTAVRSGIGAAAGAVIGAIAGGGKGAAIGSLAGGGAGAGYQLATHGQQVKIPSESVITFRLERPLRLTERE